MMFLERILDRRQMLRASAVAAATLSLPRSVGGSERKIPTGLGKLFAGKPPRQGTHSYMSPDQILRLPPAIPADIYSFGITCYELACGRQPFRANSPGELLNKHIKDQPSPPTSKPPASMVATSNPLSPCACATGASNTTKAAVGPDTCNADPPSSGMIPPAMTAV